MPKLTRWFIRSALIAFVAALVCAVLLALRNVVDLPAAVGVLTPVYFHLLMVGWVTQLIFGVALWMFPKFSAAQPRGNERLGWATFWLLNVGLLLRVVSEPLVVLQPGTAAGLVVALSAILQWLAGMGFVINTWPRVRER